MIEVARTITGAAISPERKERRDSISVSFSSSLVRS
jgi:hypothetical protein